MRYIVIFGLLFLVSCKDLPNVEFNKLPDFQKINYSVAYDYKDSLALKIIPDKKYDYWAYMNTRGKKIVFESGNKAHRDKVNFKNIETGFFVCGHPNYYFNFVALQQGKEFKTINDPISFKNFIGQIDNIEEALLIAELVGYSIGDEFIASSYREFDNFFEMRLRKCYTYPLQCDIFTVKVYRDGKLQAQNEGIYKTGMDCYR